MNKAIIMGRLGQDPESRGTVVKLNVATSERKKQDGEWVDHTEWHRVVCFGRTAENCEKFLTKGRQVLIEGRIATNKWQDKEGRDRWTTEIIADRVEFVGSKGDGVGGGNSGGSYDSGGGIPF